MGIGLESSTRVLAFNQAIWRRLEAEIHDIERKSLRHIVDLGAACPDVAPSASYVQQLSEMVCADDAFEYPGFEALPELSEAIQGWYHRRFNVQLSSGEFLPLSGAHEGIVQLTASVLSPGDEILIPDPAYPAYENMARVFSVTPLRFPAFGGGVSFDRHLAALQSVVTPRTKAIWLNYPSNPTGATVTVSQITDYIEVARKHSLWLLYDNTYSELTFDGYVAPSILEAPGAKKVAVELGSLSKNFSVCGFRLGHLVGSELIISTARATKREFDLGIPFAMQRLQAYILNNPAREWLTHTVDIYRRRRDVLADYLRGLGLSFVLPRAGVYIWARIPDWWPSAEAFSVELLRTEGVLVLPGELFGPASGRFIRATYCKSVDALI